MLGLEEPILDRAQAILGHPQAWAKGVGLYDADRFEEAALVFETLARDQIGLGTSRSADTAFSAWHQAGICRSRAQQYEQSAYAFRRAAEGRLQTRPAQDRSTWDSWLALGHALRRQNQGLEAGHAYETAARGYEANPTMGLLHPDTLAALRMAGVMFFEVQEFERALDPSLVAAKRLIEAQPADEATFEAWSNVGFCLHQLNRHLEAADAFRTTAVGRARVPSLGPFHASTLDAWHWTGHCLGHEKMFLDAATAYRHAAEGYEQASEFGPLHPLTLAAWRDVGESLRKANEPQSAIAPLQVAAEGQRMILEADDPTIWFTWYSLGAALKATGQYEIAATTLEVAARGLEGAPDVGPRDPITIHAWHLAAISRYEIGDHEQAAAAASTAAQAGRDVCPQEEWTWTAWWVLAGALHHLARHEEAAQAFRVAAEGRQTLSELGPLHPETLAAWHWAGHCNGHIPRYELSAQEYLIAARGRSRALPADSEETWADWHAAGKAFESLMRYFDAGRVFEEAARGYDYVGNAARAKASWIEAARSFWRAAEQCELNLSGGRGLGDAVDGYALAGTCYEKAGEQFLAASAIAAANHAV